MLIILVFRILIIAQQWAFFFPFLTVIQLLDTVRLTGCLRFALYSSGPPISNRDGFTYRSITLISSSGVNILSKTNKH